MKSRLAIMKSELAIMKSRLAIMKTKRLWGYSVRYLFYNASPATVPCRYYDGTPCNIWYLEDKQAVCFLIECC